VAKGDFSFYRPCIGRRVKLSPSPPPTPVRMDFGDELEKKSSPLVGPFFFPCEYRGDEDKLGDCSLSAESLFFFFFFFLLLRETFFPLLFPQPRRDNQPSTKRQKCRFLFSPSRIDRAAQTNPPPPSSLSPGVFDYFLSPFFPQKYYFKIDNP